MRTSAASEHRLDRLVGRQHRTYGDECPGERGNTRKPQFGEWMRGVWASEGNPKRDGMYVETRVRNGRCNPGTWYRLTDGHGQFWEYEAKATVFLPPNA